MNIKTNSNTNFNITEKWNKTENTPNESEILKLEKLWIGILNLDYSIFSQEIKWLVYEETWHFNIKLARISFVWEFYIVIFTCNITDDRSKHNQYISEQSKQSPYAVLFYHKTNQFLV